MSGKIIAGIIVLATLIFGVGLYYSQIYAYYDRVSAEDAGMTMVNLTTGQPEEIVVSDMEAIDGSSSPIRFRACFVAGMSDATMQETYVEYPDPTPLNAPGWFDCFDAAGIGADLEQGRAMAFLGEKDIHDGVDRVIAVYPDGRAYAWHQLNEKYQDDGHEPLD